MYKMLVVDDQESITHVLKAVFDDEYEVSAAWNGADGLDLLRKNKFDIIISDIMMPDISGLQLLQECKDQGHDTVFIVMTAYGAADTAIDALRLGAFAYVIKPFDIDHVKNVVRDGLLHIRKFPAPPPIPVSNECASACGLHRLLDNRAIKTMQQSWDAVNSENILVGNSPRIVDICTQLFSIAPVDSTVLITGEGGTGKELIAKAIHNGSRRKDRPFVAINCGSQVETLLESELFGYKKGAFTGANTDKKGLFEEATTGTLFLDEIGEMSPMMQVKLLRALQERRIRRVGGNEEIPIDVRIIAATNQDLLGAVQEKRFREDFYWRLAVIPLELPPLRERRSDLPQLVAYFLHLFSKKANKVITCLSEGAMQRIMKYPWPGNVRQLRNALERAVALETTTQIRAELFPDPEKEELPRRASDLSEADLPQEGFNLDSYLEHLECIYISKAMDLSKGSQSDAAKYLGIPVRSLRYKLDKYKNKKNGHGQG